jgi:hypothetical protein
LYGIVDLKDVGVEQMWRMCSVTSSYEDVTGATSCRAARRTTSPSAAPSWVKGAAAVHQLLTRGAPGASVSYLTNVGHGSKLVRSLDQLP